MEARQGMFNYWGGLTEEREAATRTIKEQNRALIEDGSSRETDRALEKSLFGSPHDKQPEASGSDDEWILAR